MGVFLRKPDDRLAFNHALCFQKGGLHDELVDGRTQKLRRLFKRVSHTVSHASRNPLARLFNYMFHVFMVPFWHRPVNEVSALRWIAVSEGCLGLERIANGLFPGKDEFLSLLSLRSERS